MISVLVADDQELIREGLATVLSAQPDLEVVGLAADGAEAVTLVRELRPQVTLMDIRMPGVDGLEATRRLLAGGATPTRVVVLTTFDEDALVMEALRAGASAFLLKDVPTRRLAEAIRAVHDGELLLSPAITRRLVERHLERGTTDHSATLAQLTARELDVLRRVVAGDSNAEVAAGLHLSESTVKTHVGALLAKIGARDRVHLVIFGYEAGLSG
jgi:DNA-binding NarL/FixJ family response regulator